MNKQSMIMAGLILAAVILVSLVFFFPDAIPGLSVNQELISSGGSYRPSSIPLDVQVYQPQQVVPCPEGFVPPQGLKANSHYYCKEVSGEVVYELWFANPGEGVINLDVRVTGNCVITNPDLKLTMLNFEFDDDAYKSYQDFEVVNPVQYVASGAKYSIPSSGGYGLRIAGSLQPVSEGGSCVIKVKYSASDMIEYKAGWLTKVVKEPAFLSKTVYYHYWAVGNAVSRYWGII